MSKKTITLEVEEANFLDFFYDNLDRRDLSDIAIDVITCLKNDGVFRVTSKQKFRDCGYFPFRIINFPTDAIREEFEYEFEDREIEMTEGEINGRKFKLKLV